MSVNGYGSAASSISKSTHFCKLTLQEEDRNKSNIKTDMRMVEVTEEEETVS